LRPRGIYPDAPHYSADGRFLAVPFGSAVMVWDLASRQAPVGQFLAFGYAPDAALSSDGRLLYVGTAEPPKVAAYEVTTGRAMGSAAVPGRLLQLSPDGTLLAAVGGNDVVLLDAATLAERNRLRGHVDAVQSVQFSHDGDLLASASNDRTAIVWDVATGQRREELRGHGGRVWGVDFSPDDRTLYTAGLDGTLLTWDLQGERRWIPNLPVAEPVRHATASALGSPTGEAVAYISSPFSVQFLDVATGHPGPVIDAAVGDFGAWSWRPDGRRFATAGDDGFVRVWDWRTGELVAERHVAPGHIAGLDYSGDGKHLLVGERAGAIYRIDAETLEPDGKPVQLDLVIVFAYVAPQARRAIALSGDEFAVVDLVEGRLVHRGQVGFVPGYSDFSPDGRRVAVGGGLSGEVRLLDIDSGEWLGPTRIAHSGTTSSVAYAPDGATFATAGADGRVALWDGGTGSPLGAVLPARPGIVTDVQ
jgi:WD40 repeat protein